MLLSAMGATKEDLNNAPVSAIADEFKPLESGAYKGTVKQIIKYTNQWGGDAMVYVFEVDGRELKYGGFDVGAKLKDGAPNPGWLGRLKQVLFATNAASVASFSNTPIKFNSFGKETEGNELLGCKDKPLLVLVKLVHDTSKQPGEPYEYINEIAAVVPMDGVDESGENAKNKFEEKISKTPVFTRKGKEKAKTTTAAAAAPVATDDF